MAGTSRLPHVVSSQRRDVGSTYIEVNKRQRRDVLTSRRPNVATSQRRDVPTSRRQREFCLSIIKSKKGTRIQGIGDRGAYELGHGNHNSNNFDLGEEPIILYFSSFRDRSIDV